MHQLLRRQIKRRAPFGADEVPEEWRAFMDAVSEAYEQYETDHAMVERSLELSSAELLEKNRQIEVQKGELERSNQELEHFAYIASHDLQEPLRTVQSYLQLIKRRYSDKLDQDADDFINYAVDGATRMRSLIEDLLTYARVSSRARPLEPVKVDVVIDDVLQGLEVRLQEKQAVVERGPLPTVSADRRQLGQLLQNLITNAVKFMKKDTRPVVKIDAERVGDEWFLRVQDNGIGMSQEYTEKIFVIFQRLHSREEYEGTGVGLAVCKKIVELHKGRIWVESELDKGSTFFIALPAQPDAAGDQT